MRSPAGRGTTIGALLQSANLRLSRARTRDRNYEIVYLGIFVKCSMTTHLRGDGHSRADESMTRERSRLSWKYRAQRRHRAGRGAGRHSRAEAGRAWQHLGTRRRVNDIGLLNSRRIGQSRNWYGATGGCWGRMLL